MIVDASAWIEFFRPAGRPAVKSRVGQLLESRAAAFSDPTRYEVLFGCKTPDVRALVEDTLGMIRYIPVESGDWITAADSGLALARHGRKVSMADLLLSAVAARVGAPVMTRDADFEVIQRHAITHLRVERMD
jgi:predicted nucleic acid-binding protein